MKTLDFWERLNIVKSFIFFRIRKAINYINIIKNNLILSQTSNKWFRNRWTQIRGSCRIIYFSRRNCLNFIHIIYIWIYKIKRIYYLVKIFVKILMVVIALVFLVIVGWKLEVEIVRTAWPHGVKYHLGHFFCFFFHAKSMRLVYNLTHLRWK